MAILPFDAEQRWSDGSDSLTSTDVSRKSRRKSDVTEDIVDENEGTGNVFVMVLCVYMELLASLDCF